MIKSIVPPKQTYIAYILDRSGSMAEIAESTVSAFNEQFQDHKRHAGKGGQTFFTLVQFDDVIEDLIVNQPIESLEGELTAEDFVPRGLTALYDAIGYTIQKLQKFDRPGDVAFLVVILSDGKNNSSKKYDSGRITDLRKELQGTGRWTFQYVGCDEAAIKEAKSLGFQTASFHKSAPGLEKLNSRLRTSNDAFYTARMDGHTSVCNFLSDEDEK